MKPIYRLVIALTASLMAAPVLAEDAARFKQGVHYFALDNATAAGADTETVSVVEVFSYACGGCGAFQPYMENWLQKKPDHIRYSRLPVGWRNWAVFARGYYTAEMLDILDASHKPMFTALHKEGQPFRDIEDLAEFYARFDISKEQFLATSRSFAVDMKLRRANQQLAGYAIPGTPTLVVNEKYRVTANRSLSYQQLLEVVDFLVAKEIQAMQPAAPAETETPAPATTGE